MKCLQLASCMADNTEALCSSIAEIIEVEVGIRTEYVSGIPWQERERLFDLGEIQILWLCGLPYVNKADLADSGMELLAVPLPSGPRYHGRPVYYSDVVVRRESPFESFIDLRGAAFAYNEPRSHSGFNVVRAYLAELGQRDGYFGRAVESGAHARSVGMILSGSIDCAAIDSTVLEWLQARRADSADELRVVETIGPSPIPPWVVSKTLAAPLRRQIRQILLHLHLNPR
ncbi:MAG TPA: PhnD/SsuA/transferrin family substrate-binding protein, partial [Candidatus Binatia bacterium]|nr:PhnD/SsuA/transferrin family substrate-binding protein [Candidatus Binatia bacterium]